MPTGEEFLSGWTNVVQGGISTPSIVSAVTPITVTAGEMHQLINTPGVQVTTIPVTISVTSAAEMAPFTIQSQLWLEGHQPKVDDEEGVVEMELDVEQEDSQEEKESEFQEKEPSKGDETQEEPETQTKMSEEGLSEEESSIDKKKGGGYSHSTLTVEEDLDAEQVPTSKPLRPIPSLVDGTASLLTSSAAFDLEDPLGVKAMRAALAETTGSKGPKGLRKCKATMPLKKLIPAIKLARENAHLKLKGSTPSGYYKRPKAPRGKDG